MQGRCALGIAAVFLVFFPTAVILHAPTAGAGPYSHPDSLSERITELRRDGRYTEALETARNLVELLNRDPSAKRWELDDAQRLVATLESVSHLSKEAQGEMAEADRLTAEVEAVGEQGEYVRAIELAEREVGIRTRLLGELHQEVARNLDQLVVLLRSQGQYPRAEPLCRKVLQMRQDLLGPEHPEVATSLNNLGTVLANQGHLGEAEKLFGEALIMRTRLLGDENDGVAETLNNLGMLCVEQADWARAEPPFRRALAILQRIHGGEDWRTVLTLKNIAGLLTNQGRYAEAEPLYRQVLAVRRKLLGKEHPSVAVSLGELGAILYRRGDFLGAEPLFREALAMQRGILSAEHPQVAWNLNNLANVLYAKGNLTGAEPLYREALAMRRKLLGDEHPDVAQSLHNLAYLLLAEDKFEEAEALLRESLEIRRKSLGVEHPKVARCINDLAGLLTERGDYAGAESLYREALAMRRKLLGEEHPDVAESLHDLARLLTGRGDYVGAEPLYREALAIRRRFLGNEHMAVAIALRNLASCVYAQGEAAEAESLLAEAADVFETARVRAGTGFERATFQTSPYWRLAAIRLERGKTDQAWPAAERALGRGLADLLIASSRQSLSASEAAREDSLGRMLDQLQGQLAALGKASGGGVQDETARRFEETRSRLLAAEAAWKVFQGDIASKYPIAKGAAFPLARVQKALGKQTALLGWLVMETKPGESAYWGYVIRGSGPARWARLGIPSQGGEETSLLETPRAFREELVTTAGWRSRVTSVDAITEDAAALWAGWLAPLEPYLEGAKNLVVIPSGPMLGVPVEALVDSAGNYLEDRWAISYAPSATILTWLREKAAERPGGPIHAALLVGDPPFSDDQLAVMEGMEEDHPELSPASTAEEFPAQASLFRSALAGDGAALAALPRLPKTREETERIASLMPEATILLGPEASEQELVDLAEGEALARFDVIHLATHALVDDERPECSALVLSRANLPEPLEAAMAGTRIFDGLLTVNEVVREWRLDADLVTLSGCRTALGKEASGEGYVGLAYAFLQAGARSLLVSLWRVEDEATCLLMGRFYENLTGHYGVERGGRSAKPMPKTEALQEAKHWLRTYTDGEGQQPFRHPVYWSGFVLIGDPG